MLGSSMITVLLSCFCLLQHYVAAELSCTDQTVTPYIFNETTSSTQVESEFGNAHVYTYSCPINYVIPWSDSSQRSCPYVDEGDELWFRYEYSYTPCTGNYTLRSIQSGLCLPVVHDSTESDYGFCTYSKALSLTWDDQGLLTILEANEYISFRNESNAMVAFLPRDDVDYIPRRLVHDLNGCLCSYHSTHNSITTMFCLKSDALMRLSIERLTMPDYPPVASCSTRWHFPQWYNSLCFNQTMCDRKSGKSPAVDWRANDVSCRNADTNQRCGYDYRLGNSAPACICKIAPLCPIPPLTLDYTHRGSLDDTDQAYVTAVYACNSQATKVAGDETRLCNNGFYSGEQLVCLPICMGVVAPYGAILLRTEGPLWNRTSYLVCLEEYVQTSADGTHVILCNSSSEVFVCQPICPSLNYQKVSIFLTGNPINQVANISCADGFYQPQGVDSILLQCTNAAWPDISLECSRECTEAPDIQLAVIEYENKSVAVYSCVAPYQMILDPALYCVDGIWTGSIKCDLTCKSPPAMQHATFYLNGSIGIYKCKDGYHVTQGYSDNLSVTCINNSFILPHGVDDINSLISCEKDCSNPPQFEYANVRTDEYTSKYTCKMGWSYVSGSSSMNCTQGYWEKSGETFLCKPNCDQGHIPEVENAVWEIRGPDHEFNVAYRCLQKYTLAEEYNVSCGNGSISGVVPVCAPECPPAPIIPFSSYTTKGPAHEVVFHYYCENGFTMSQGAAQLYCVGGVILGCPPTCSINCEEAPRLSNADLVVVGDPHEHHAVYHCHNGYILRGPNSLECTNGKYLTDPPECIQGCPNFQPDKGMDCSESGGELHWFYVCACAEGFTNVSGNAKFNCTDGIVDSDRLVCMPSCSLPLKEKSVVCTSSGPIWKSEINCHCTPDHVRISGDENLLCGNGVYNGSFLECGLSRSIVEQHQPNDMPMKFNELHSNNPDITTEVGTQHSGTIQHYRSNVLTTQVAETELDTVALDLLADNIKADLGTSLVSSVEPIIYGGGLTTASGRPLFANEELPITTSKMTEYFEEDTISSTYQKSARAGEWTSENPQLYTTPRGYFHEPTPEGKVSTVDIASPSTIGLAKITYDLKNPSLKNQETIPSMYKVPSTTDGAITAPITNKLLHTTISAAGNTESKSIYTITPDSASSSMKVNDIATTFDISLPTTNDQIGDLHIVTESHFFYHSVPSLPAHTTFISNTGDATGDSEGTPPELVKSTTPILPTKESPRSTTEDLASSDTTLGYPGTLTSSIVTSAAPKSISTTSETVLETISSSPVTNHKSSGFQESTESTIYYWETDKEITIDTDTANTTLPMTTLKYENIRPFAVSKNTEMRGPTQEPSELHTDTTIDADIKTIASLLDPSRKPGDATTDRLFMKSLSNSSRTEELPLTKSGVMTVSSGIDILTTTDSGSSTGSTTTDMPIKETDTESLRNVQTFSLPVITSIDNPDVVQNALATTVKVDTETIENFFLSFSATVTPDDSVTDDKFAVMPIQTSFSPVLSSHKVEYDKNPTATTESTLSINDWASSNSFVYTSSQQYAGSMAEIVKAAFKTSPAIRINSNHRTAPVTTEDIPEFRETTPLTFDNWLTRDISPKMHTTDPLISMEVEETEATGDDQSHALETAFTATSLEVEQISDSFGSTIYAGSRSNLDTVMQGVYTKAESSIATDETINKLIVTTDTYRSLPDDITAKVTDENILRSTPFITARSESHDLTTEVLTAEVLLSAPSTSPQLHNVATEITHKGVTMSSPSHSLPHDVTVEVTDEHRLSTQSTTAHSPSYDFMTEVDDILASTPSLSHDVSAVATPGDVSMSAHSTTAYSLPYDFMMVVTDKKIMQSTPSHALSRDVTTEDTVRDVAMSTYSATAHSLPLDFMPEDTDEEIMVSVPFHSLSYDVTSEDTDGDVMLSTPSTTVSFLSSDVTSEDTNGEAIMSAPSTSVYSLWHDIITAARPKSHDVMTVNTSGQIQMSTPATFQLHDATTEVTQKWTTHSHNSSRVTTEGTARDIAISTHSVTDHSLPYDSTAEVTAKKIIMSTQTPSLSQEVTAVVTVGDVSLSTHSTTAHFLPHDSTAEVTDEDLMVSTPSHSISPDVMTEATIADIATSTHSTTAHSLPYDSTAEVTDEDLIVSTPSHSMLPDVMTEATTADVATSTHSTTAHSLPYDSTAEVTDEELMVSTPSHSMSPDVMAEATTADVPTSTHTITAYSLLYDFTAEVSDEDLMVSIPSHSISPDVITETIAADLATSTHFIAAPSLPYDFTAEVTNKEIVMSTPTPSLSQDLTAVRTAGDVALSTHSTSAHSLLYDFTAEVADEDLMVSIPSLSISPDVITETIVADVATSTHSTTAHSLPYDSTAEVTDEGLMVSTLSHTISPDVMTEATTVDVATSTPSIAASSLPYDFTAEVTNKEIMMSTHTPSLSQDVTAVRTAVGLSTHSTATHSLPYDSTAEVTDEELMVSTPSHSISPDVMTEATTADVTTSTHSIAAHSLPYDFTAEVTDTKLMVSAPSHSISPDVMTKATTVDVATSTHSTTAHSLPYDSTAEVTDEGLMVSTLSHSISPDVMTEATTVDVATSTPSIAAPSLPYDFTTEVTNKEIMMSTPTPSLSQDLTAVRTAGDVALSTHSTAAHSLLYDFTAEVADEDLMVSIPSLSISPDVITETIAADVTTSTHSIAAHSLPYDFTAEVTDKKLMVSAPSHSISPDVMTKATTVDVATSTHSTTAHSLPYDSTAEVTDEGLMVSTPSHSISPDVMTEATTADVTTSTHSIAAHSLPYDFTAEVTDKKLMVSAPSHSISPDVMTKATTVDVATSTPSIAASSLPYDFTAEVTNKEIMMSTHTPSSSQDVTPVRTAVGLSTHSTATHSLPYDSTAEVTDEELMVSTPSNSISPDVMTEATTADVTTSTHSIAAHSLPYDFTAEVTDKKLMVSAPSHSISPDVMTKATTVDVATSTHSTTAHSLPYDSTAEVTDEGLMVSTLSHSISPDVMTEATAGDVALSTHSTTAQSLSYDFTAEVTHEEIPTHSHFLLHNVTITPSVTAEDVAMSTHSTTGHPRSYDFTMEVTDEEVIISTRSHSQSHDVMTEAIAGDVAMSIHLSTTRSSPYEGMTEVSDENMLSTPSPILLYDGTTEGTTEDKALSTHSTTTHSLSYDFTTKVADERMLSAPSHSLLHNAMTEPTTGDVELSTHSNTVPILPYDSTAKLTDEKLLVSTLVNSLSYNVTAEATAADVAMSAHSTSAHSLPYEFTTEVIDEEIMVATPSRTLSHDVTTEGNAEDVAISTHSSTSHSLPYDVTTEFTDEEILLAAPSTTAHSLLDKVTAELRDAVGITDMLSRSLPNDVSTKDDDKIFVQSTPSTIVRSLLHDITTAVAHKDLRTSTEVTIDGSAENRQPNMSTLTIIGSTVYGAAAIDDDVRETISILGQADSFSGTDTKQTTPIASADQFATLFATGSRTMHNCDPNLPHLFKGDDGHCYHCYIGEFAILVDCTDII